MSLVLIRELVSSLNDEQGEEWYPTLSLRFYFRDFLFALSLRKFKKVVRRT